MIIGITGNIASGKTEVAKTLKQCLGGIVINADRVAHELYTPHSLVWQAIVREFGKSILLKNSNEIKRTALGAIVFKDYAKLKILEAIVHPHVVRDIKKRVMMLQKKTPTMPILLEVIKLFDSPLLKLVEKTIVVTTTKEDQIARLLSKDYTMEEALARIDAYKVPEKTASITWKIENIKGLKALTNKVEKEYKQALGL